MNTNNGNKRLTCRHKIDVGTVYYEIKGKKTLNYLLLAAGVSDFN